MTLNLFGPAGAILERTSITASTENFFDHNDFWSGSGPFEHELQIMPSFTFRGGRTLTFMIRNGYFRFQPERYANYAILDEDGSQSPFLAPGALKNLKAFMVFPRLRITNKFSLNGMYIARETAIFSEASRGFELQARPEIQWSPTDRLELSIDHTFSRISRSPSKSQAVVLNEIYSTVHITNIKAQYLFSRALMARMILQYDLDNREALKDPTTGQQLAIFGQPQGPRSNGEFQGQFLLQYEPSPGTIFYIGFSRLMQGERSYRISRMNPVEEGLFLKLSYLFRI